VARIERASIDQVVAAADMLEVVGRYTQLKKAGANYSGLCPFHDEKTPSFSVNPADKLYYCFGCGEGGDLLNFVQKKEGLDFTGAVELLAERFGVELRYEDAPAADDAGRRRRERLRQLLGSARDYYERILWTTPAAKTAREYLERRGLHETVCREYHLGYSLPGWDRLTKAATAKGFGAAELLEAGLVVQSSKDGRPAGRQSGPAGGGTTAARVYDRFRGRLMFPLADERGRVLGFGARTLGDEKPKYVNSPETPLYHKSEALFGLDSARDAARRADRIYVVEGYTDVMALAQAGVPNVVASMGTALTEQQVRALMKHTRSIYLCFDADAAGQGAMLRALALARSLNVTFHVVRIPAGKDPADWVLAGNDADAFAGLAVQAQTLLQFHVRSVLSAHDLAKPDERTRALTLLKGVLAEAPSPIERDEEVRYVADSLRLTSESVVHLLSGISAGGRTGPGERASSATSTRLLSGERDLEARFLAACLMVPADGAKCVAAVGEEHFSDPGMRGAAAVVRTRLQRLDPARAGEKPVEEEEDAGSPDGPAASALAEVMVRAAGERYDEKILLELFLRLQEAEVTRQIAAMRASLRAGGERLRVQGRQTTGGPASTEATDTPAADEDALVKLEARRRRLREEIRRVPLEEQRKPE
jgi:DNA primase